MSEWLSMAGNVISGITGSAIQNDMARKNAEYQWDRYYSPRAQVNNLAEAGINPAVAFGNQSPVMTTGGQLTMPDAPALGLGTTALAEIGQYINAKATAAKTERETGKVDAETKKLLSELDAQNLQNDLVRQFGNQKWTYDVAQAYENVLLARKTNDIKEQEKAINEYHKVTSYLESNLKGSELQMVKKRLANLDTEIELSNKLQTEKIATEKSAQTSNYASAKASSAQASFSEHQQTLIDYQSEFQNMVNQVKRSNLSSETLTELKKILANRALSEAEQKEAQLRMQHVEAFINARKMSAAWREFDNACNWISSKISASISGSFSSTSKD